MNAIRSLIFALILAAVAPVGLLAQTAVPPPQGGIGKSTTPTTNGKIPIWDTATSAYQPGDPFITSASPAIVHKATANVGGSSVKTLTDTITATTAGNSLIVDVCAGSVANGSTIILTLTETGGSDTWTLAATQAQSTTFACSIYYSSNITAGVTAVIATFSGASSANTTIAMEAYEVSGLITSSPQALEATATGNATSTTLFAGQVLPDTPNQYAFAAFGVGTAAQTVTLTGSPTWVNDSGQVNPTSASGLFSFVAASEFTEEPKAIYAGGTITSEPWVAVLAVFQPIALTAWTPPVYPSNVSNFATPVCTAAMTGTTSTVTVAAPGAGAHLYITALIATNSHASVDTFVLFQDGSGGTTLWEGFALHAGGGFTQSFPIPLRVPTANNGFFAQDVTTGANVIACATGYFGP